MDATLQIGRHAQPGVWRFMLPEDAAWMRLPDERLATCAECYQVLTGEFRDDCRCCTHFPEVPNFLVGLALKDPHSSAAVKRVLERGHAIPHAMVAAPHRYRAAVIATADDRYGNDPSLRCPFVELGSFSCQIYPYRNSTCSTFFCVHDHGDDGSRLWERVQLLAGKIEITLAQWAMDQVGLDSAQYFARLDALAGDVAAASNADTGGWSEQALEWLWGPWRNRPSEFFEACAERVLERRDTLYSLACERPLHEALKFEQAVRDWLPVAYRDAAPPVADVPGQATGIEDLWYQLQLALRNVWSLPFNDGEVCLDEHVLICLNPCDDDLTRKHRDIPYLVEKRPSAQSDPGHPSPTRRFLSARQRRVLELFEAPRVLGEDLFSCEEIRDLGDDARGFLAECLRLGLLRRCEGISRRESG